MQPTLQPSPDVNWHPASWARPGEPASQLCGYCGRFIFALERR